MLSQFHPSFLITTRVRKLVWLLIEYLTFILISNHWILILLISFIQIVNEISTDWLHFNISWSLLPIAIAGTAQIQSSQSLHHGCHPWSGIMKWFHLIGFATRIVLSLWLEILVLMTDWFMIDLLIRTQSSIRNCLFASVNCVKFLNSFCFRLPLVVPAYCLLETCFINWNY